MGKLADAFKNASTTATKHQIQNGILEKMLGCSTVLRADRQDYTRLHDCAEPVVFKQIEDRQALEQEGITTGTYYTVYEDYSDPVDPGYVPLKIDIGFIGRDGRPQELCSIYMDHERQGHIDIHSVTTYGLGLDSPNGKEETMAAIRAIGDAMKDIDNGIKLDPNALRQRMIDEAGLSPNQWGLQSFRQKQYDGVISHHPEIEAANKAKHLLIRRHRKF